MKKEIIKIFQQCICYAHPKWQILDSFNEFLMFTDKYLKRNKKDEHSTFCDTIDKWTNKA